MIDWLRGKGGHPVRKSGSNTKPKTEETEDINLAQKTKSNEKN